MTIPVKPVSGQIITDKRDGDYVKASEFNISNIEIEKTLVNHYDVLRETGTLDTGQNNRLDAIELKNTEQDTELSKKEYITEVDRKDTELKAYVDQQDGYLSAVDNVLNAKIEEFSTTATLLQSNITGPFLTGALPAQPTKIDMTTYKQFSNENSDVLQRKYEATSVESDKPYLIYKGDGPYSTNIIIEFDCLETESITVNVHLLVNKVGLPQVRYPWNTIVSAISGTRVTLSVSFDHHKDTTDNQEAYIEYWTSNGSQTTNLGMRLQTILVSPTTDGGGTGNYIDTNHVQSINSTYFPDLMPQTQINNTLKSAVQNMSAAAYQTNFNGDVSITGKVTAGSFTTTGTVTAGSFTTTGTVTAPNIVKTGYYALDSPLPSGAIYSYYELAQYFENEITTFYSGDTYKIGLPAMNGQLEFIGDHTSSGSPRSIIRFTEENGTVYNMINYYTNYTTNSSADIKASDWVQPSGSTVIEMTNLTTENIITFPHTIDPKDYKIEITLRGTANGTLSSGYYSSLFGVKPNTVNAAHSYQKIFTDANGVVKFESENVVTNWYPLICGRFGEYTWTGKIVRATELSINLIGTQTVRGNLGGSPLDYVISSDNNMASSNANGILSSLSIYGVTTSLSTSSARASVRITPALPGTTLTVLATASKENTKEINNG